MMLVNLSAYVLALLVSLPLLVLAAECFLSLFPTRKSPLGERKNCTVLIPAHNEEAGLVKTLENVQSQLYPHDRLVVVADNCTDRTADVARAGGAEVVVREDQQKRGKGFALEAGITFLRNDACGSSGSRDVVVMLDADCLLAPGSLDHLVRATISGQRPQQAQYLMHLAKSSSPSRRLSAFAFLTKNLVRPRGMNRLGLSVPLTGSGMSFPWGIINGVELGTPEIVEDLELGLRLVMDGHGASLCEAARVDSYFPDSESAAKQQRTRWEHGYIGQMRRKVPPLIVCGCKGNLQALASCLDLFVPPLSLLVTFAATASLFLCAHYFVSQDPLPIGMLLVSCTVSSIGLGAAWYRFGRETVPFVEFLWIPAYATSKLATYLRLPFRAETEWKRTQRDPQNTSRMY